MSLHIIIENIMTSILSSPNIVQTLRDKINEPKILRYVLDDPNAQPLFKANPTDTGFDLTLIKRMMKNNEGKFEEITEDPLFKTITFDTGIVFSPPEGYYLDMVPRSSLSERGYIFANSLGVIDNPYRGHVMAKLVKFDADKPDLQLPGRYVQVILRRIQECETEIIAKEDLDNTVRGEKGFGSSGV